MERKEIPVIHRWISQSAECTNNSSEMNTRHSVPGRKPIDLKKYPEPYLSSLSKQYESKKISMHKFYALSFLFCLAGQT